MNLFQTWNRVGRAARRYMATGRFRSAPEPMIDRFFGGKDCFFVQVGSNDGVSGDPLHNLIVANPHWRGIFIEPLDEIFEKLVAHYPADGRFAFEQIAISDSAGEQWFYYVSRETIRECGLPETMQAFSSFNRDLLLKNIAMTKSRHQATFTREPEAYISKKPVRCETLTSVLDRHGISRVDLLHIDAESYDYRIIRQIDFSRVRPKLILYEHCNLGEEANAAAALLSRNGYRLVNCGLLDTMAVRRGKA